MLFLISHQHHGQFYNCVVCLLKFLYILANSCLARILGEILQALGSDNTGSQDEKLGRFRLLVGLRTDTA
jgi:hypothetical protein